jgi:phosphoserine phosphatase RsbU/P
LLQEREHRALLDERAAGELRGRFIAMLGNDLRNPPHAAYASSDTLERKLTDPPLLNIAHRIRNNVQRVSALIDDVLDFARAWAAG